MEGKEEIKRDACWSVVYAGIVTSFVLSTEELEDVTPFMGISSSYHQG